ncbi:MAG: right-handed parallel beta-helix repeat-containing protein [Candidatus Eisenbacteria bacterium]
MRCLLLVLAAAVLLIAGPASCHTIYISPDGSGDVPTIQAGISLAVSGDTLLLASGTFRGAGNYNMVVPDKAILIRSETGNAGDCVIDGEEDLDPSGLRHVFDIEKGNLVLDGITIRDAGPAVLAYNTSSGGSGLSITARDCAFVSNSTEGSGGAFDLYCWTCNAVISNCTFTSNEAGCGGAIYFYGIYFNITIDGCTFNGNRAYWPGGGAIYCDGHEADAIIRNSVFCGNWSGSYGGAIAVNNMAGGARIAGCTFFANHAPEGSAISAYVGEAISNCIIAYGTGGCGFYHVDDPDYGPNIGCTDIHGNEGGDWVGVIAGMVGQGGDFSVCPGFCYHEGEPYDLRLCSTSPCLPGNHPAGTNCGLIGALGDGCACGPSAIQPSTWGAIKAIFR